MTETKSSNVPKPGERKLEINTAEDATFAFLRNEIDEAEFRDWMGYFGVLPGKLLLSPTNLERPDAAFENTIPDDIFVPESEANPNLEERLAAAKEKEEEREKASKSAEKESKTEASSVTPQKEVAKTAGSKS